MPITTILQATFISVNKNAQNNFFDLNLNIKLSLYGINKTK